MAVAAQVESTRSGLAMLQAAQAAIEKLRNDFEAIDALCRECASLIQSHDKIQLLSEVHFNIQQTLKVEDERGEGKVSGAVLVTMIAL